MNSINRRVEMSLSLTAANEIVAYLSTQENLDVWTLSKLAILFTVALVAVDNLWKNGEFFSDGGEREGIVKLLSVTRQISILAVARILLHLVQGPLPSIIHTSHYTDLVPLTMWPLFEALFKSSLVVVLMAFTIQTSRYSEIMYKFAPEFERIMYCLQFMFADNIMPLVVDYRLKR
jgi:hypothetical protein